MAKVYITNSGGHDYSDALRFGEFIYLSEGRVDKNEVVSMKRNFREILAESVSEDYLLITSLTQMNVIAGVILAMKHGRINFLIYNHGAGYKDRTVMFDDIEKVIPAIVESTPNDHE